MGMSAVAFLKPDFIKALINANTRIQDKVYENPTGDTTPAQSDAYNISKRILKYHAQKYLPEWNLE